MNIFESLTATKAEGAVATKGRTDFLICPDSRSFPEDGVIQYISINDVHDVDTVMRADTKLGVPVAAFGEAALRVLEMLTAYSDLYDIRIVMVDGIPGADYNSKFDSAAWSALRLSYHSLINDLIEVGRRVEEKDASRDLSIYDKQIKQETRSNGSIKEFKAFELPDSDFGHDSEDE